MTDPDAAVAAALAAHRRLAAAQTAWAEQEQQLKAELAHTLRTALDARAGADTLAHALGISRARIYQLTGPRQ